MHFSVIAEIPEDSSADIESGAATLRHSEPMRIRPFLAKVAGCIRCLEFHGFKEHVQFFVAAMRHRAVFQKLAQPAAGDAIERLIADRPRYFSLLIAPYMDARWSSAERVDRLIEQASLLRGSLDKYNFRVSQSLPLLDLSEIGMPGYSVMIDKPEWFCHEGLITLNLCKSNFRLFSITFSFYSNDSGRGIVIGGMQGRKADNILNAYRVFTKLAFGLRPRDFLLEILRMIARAEKVRTIIGVPDRFRYHRHAYFAADNRQDLLLNYDEVWQDRGGSINDDGMYEIPLSAGRMLSLIAAKKRSIHRRRYDMLALMEYKLRLNLQIAMPVPGIHLD